MSRRGQYVVIAGVVVGLCLTAYACFSPQRGAPVTAPLAPATGTALASFGQSDPRLGRQHAP